MQAFQRVNKEIKELQKVPDRIWSISNATTITAEDLAQGLVLKLTLKVLPDVIFPQEQSLTLDIHIPSSYPNTPPLISCPGAFSHDKIDPDSRRIETIVTSTDEKGWSRNYSIAAAVWSTRRVFLRPQEPWNRLSPVLFLPTQPVPSSPTSLYLDEGSAQHIGTRPVQEDRVVCCTELSSRFLGEQAGLFLVADGHAGDDSSQFIVDNFKQMFLTMLEKVSGDIRKGLFETFRAIETELHSHESESGSTCACVVFDGNHTLFCGNVGDCRALLCRAGEAIALSHDHKAINAEEVARVADNGGFVSMGRVFGQLAISRTMGDKMIKQTNSPNTLIGDPEITQVPIQAGIDQFIVIGSDGLYDVMTNEEVVKQVVKADEMYDDVAKIAHELVEEAIDGRVISDNVSVVVLRISQGKRNSNSNTVPTVVAEATTTVKTEDDLMDFLMDDSNF